MTRTDVEGKPHPLPGRRPADEEAIAATTGLVEAAEATGNPWALSFALLGFGAADLMYTPIRPVLSRQVAAGRRWPKAAATALNGTNLATVVARMEGRVW